MLGIDETADDEVVRAAYLAAVRRSPPDRDPEGFRRVREAYDAVRDEERRLALRLFGPAPLDSLLANQNLRRLGALMAVDSEGRLSGVITIEQVGRAFKDATTSG